MKTLLKAGAVQALLLSRQRELLRELAVEVGAEVLFLKAGWADSVLYGGRGERVGCDLDVLVTPARFTDYANALEACGFTRYEPSTHRATITLGSKEWTYSHPGAWMPVDLHRELAEPPWFDLEVGAVLARAVEWPAVGGPIRSLGPEDQVLYAAVHYANHLYEIDDRHAGDIARLLASHTVDWSLIYAEADRGGMRLVAELFTEHLRARGLDVPDAPWSSSLRTRLRRGWVGRWVDVGPTFKRRSAVGRYTGLLLERPVLSDRWEALPRWALRYAALRGLDRILQ